MVAIERFGEIGRLSSEKRTDGADEEWLYILTRGGEIDLCWLKKVEEREEKLELEKAKEEEEDEDWEA